MPSVFQQMTRQVYNAEPYSLTGKIENIVGMSIGRYLLHLQRRLRRAGHCRGGGV